MAIVDRGEWRKPEYFFPLSTYSIIRKYQVVHQQEHAFFSPLVTPEIEKDNQLKRFKRLCWIH